MHRLYARLVSSIYMMEVFAGFVKMGKRDICQNNWSVLLHNPRWFFNDGVWVILINEIFTLR
jgi:hypothetical protein